VHSGPVSAIRYVGVVGLTIFLVLLLLIARRAARLIRRAQGTPYYPMAVVMGLGTILTPFNFLFIFGTFETDFPGAMLAVGIQQMLENSLAVYEANAKKPESEPIEPPKFRPARQFAPVA